MESDKTKNEYSKNYNSYVTLYNNQESKVRGREIIEGEIEALSNDIDQFKRNLRSRFNDFTESVSEGIKIKDEVLKPIDKDLKLKFDEGFSDLEKLAKNMDSFYNKQVKDETLNKLTRTLNTIYRKEFNNPDEEGPVWHIELIRLIFDKIQAFKNRKRIAQDVINSIITGCYPANLELLEVEGDKIVSEGKVRNEDYTDEIKVSEGEVKQKKLIQKWLDKDRLTNNDRYNAVIEIKRELNLNSDKRAFEFALKKGIDFGGQTKYSSWVKMNQRSNKKSGRN